MAAVDTLRTRRFAHSVSGLSSEHWQGLRDHLEAVAAGARLRANKFGAGSWGQAAGLLHDVGKYSDEWQAYLLGGPQVEHSTAGAQVAVQQYDRRGRILAAVIAGHHAGLANSNGEGKRTPLVVRLSQTRAGRLGLMSRPARAARALLVPQPRRQPLTQSRHLASAIGRHWLIARSGTIRLCHRRGDPRGQEPPGFAAAGSRVTGLIGRL